MKKNRKIKRFISLIKDGIRNFIDKLNWHYIVITVIILVGIGVLVGSYWISDPELKNIAVGLGTGIVTSALVTLCIDLMNARIEQRKLAKYKRMLLNPLCNAIKTLYVQIALSVNEYRVREEKGHYFLLPLEDTKELSHFFNEMKDIDIESVGDEKKKNRLVDFISVSSVYLKEVISQYEGLPFESLILDNIITQEEFDQLKRFTLVNECKKCLGILGDKTLSEKDRYNTSVQLLYCMMLFINRLMRIFDFIALKIEIENDGIKKHLDDIYYNEIYIFSDEYVEQWAERAEAEAEYYAEHPELLEEVEESEEEQLHRKINTAIWAGDVETIKACFPQIDKNNKQIQSELTWSVAKDVMKDKVLQELYFQKYGIKYKVRKDKRRKQ